MATVNQSVATATSQATALATFIGTNSVLKIYSGTIPSTPETAVTGTLLVSITLATVSASGTVVTSSDPSAVAPTASGTAGYARLVKSDGTTVVCDLDVGTSGTSVTLGTTTISTGTNVDLSALTVTIPSV